MKTDSRKDVITGQETEERLDTPFQALVTFYKAFNSRDLNLMERVWLNNHEPSMDNPIGGIRRGWIEIQEVYRKLFSGNLTVYVEFHDYSLQQGKEWTLAVGRERGRCSSSKGGKSIHLEIRTSRLFVLHENHWRQIHHHGSIEYGELLMEYQKMVSGEPLKPNG
jgi:hypothetical protein